MHGVVATTTNKTADDGRQGENAKIEKAEAVDVRCRLRYEAKLSSSAVH